jgi:hypothetical protein
MKYGEVDVQLHEFLISALDGGEESTTRSSRFTPGTHSIGGWVGPRAGEEKDASPWRESNSCHYTACTIAAVKAIKVTISMNIQDEMWKIWCSMYI